ncbi:hypothetical protein [Pseudoxanthomonas putridarboris]|uniref:Uncharacterized protein n=1 Tax=Pseudoxanthomonas putridarboris TaxID=752605 RepID=A0ABU9J364_9GAMM
MSETLKPVKAFPAWARLAFLACAAICAIVGQAWVPWHPLELAMDLLAPLMFVFLSFARTPDDQWARFALASRIALIAVMLAAAKWMKFPA